MFEMRFGLREISADFSMDTMAAHEERRNFFAPKFSGAVSIRVGPRRDPAPGSKFFARPPPQIPLATETSIRASRSSGRGCLVASKLVQQLPVFGFSRTAEPNEIVRSLSGAID